MSARVIVYTTDYCPYCTRAKQLLSRKGIAFDELDVSADPAKRQWLITTTGQRTVPQIFIDQRSIGGCDELYALDRRGELDRLLAAAPEQVSP